MADVVEFLTSKELIVVYVIIGVICLLGFIIFLIDKSNEKRKKRQNTRELNKLVNMDDNYETKEEFGQSDIPQNILYVENEIKSEPVVGEKGESVNNILQNVENNIESITENKTDNKQKSIIELKEENIVVPIVESTPITIEPVIEELKKEESIVSDKVENLVLDSMPTDETNTSISDELQYTSIEPNPTEAQAELKKLTEELQKAQEVTKNISLTSLEEEQEKNAIISLDELIKRSQEKYFETTLEKYEDDDENKPISIEELEKMRNNIVGSEPTIEPIEEISNDSNIINVENSPIIEKQKVVEIHQEKMVLDEFNNIKLDETKPVYQEAKKFKSSPVISPVYGIENKQVRDTQLELENTANYEKLDEEIKKTNEFLMTLKELQKKLD